MKTTAKHLPLVRRTCIMLMATAFVLGAPASASAGRPTIFELQHHLKQMPEKQRAREASKPAPISFPQNQEARDNAPHLGK